MDTNIQKLNQSTQRGLYEGINAIDKPDTSTQQGCVNNVMKVVQASADTRIDSANDGEKELKPLIDRQTSIPQASKTNEDIEKQSLELISLLSNDDERYEVEEIKNFLQNGNIDINYIDISGYTAFFHELCTWQSSEIISLLLEYGADPNLKYTFYSYFNGKYKEGLTLLMIAIDFLSEHRSYENDSKNFTKIIYLLLNYDKLDFSVNDKHGNTDLMRFVMGHNDLFQKEDQFYRNDTFQKTLETSKNILEKLLAKTDAVNTANDYGQTPVMLATKHTNCHVCNVL
jgi:ankyrin repeat protein